MNKTFIAIQFVVIIALAGLFAAYVRTNDPKGSTFLVSPVQATSTLPATMATSELPLINPAVTINAGKHFIINFKPLEDQFKGIQTRYPQKTYVYFVYLNNAAFVSIHSSTMFTAASTVKVPLAMAIMKMIEEGKLSLSQSYTLDELDLNDQFGTLYMVGADKSFTLQELLRIMLEYSDNTAMNALIKAAKLAGQSDPFSDVYNFMGWGGSGFNDTPTYNQIDLRTLSNMFIALYNAKYDDAHDSQLILHYLDDSTENDQIPAGVPGAISVAHKFGVNASDKTYSDCGIVYAPGRNYLLCIGSVGADQKAANRFMAEISKAAYEYVIKD